jgi:hypothetical protein
MVPSIQPQKLPCKPESEARMNIRIGQYIVFPQNNETRHPTFIKSKIKISILPLLFLLHKWFVLLKSAITQKEMGFGKLTLIKIKFHTQTKSQNLEAKF